MNEDTVLNIREAWLSELKFSEDAERTQTLLAPHRPSPILTVHFLPSSA